MTLREFYLHSRIHHAPSRCVTEVVPFEILDLGHSQRRPKRSRTYATPKTSALSF